MTSKRSPICDTPRLRQHMAARGIDLVLANSKRNVAYLTDHQTANWTWEHAILHMMEKEYDGADYVVMAGLAADPSIKSFIVEYAHREDAINQRGMHADEFYGYWRRGERPQVDGPGISLERDMNRTSEEAAVQSIRDRKLERSTIGIELCRMPAAQLQRLRELLPQARFVDAFDLLFEVRQIKTPEEIRRLRQAYAVATEIYRQVFADVAPGMTPREILLREMREIYARGCSFSFAHIFFASGGVTDIALTPPADRKIAPGDVGVFDLGVVYEGYGSDYARMADVAPGCSALREVYPVILDARRAIEAALKPGTSARDVYRAGETALEKGGLCASISCLGHGLGLDCHEKPFITSYSDDVIMAGQTICIEIYCEVRGVGPILMEDGGVMTESGWQSFSPLPIELLTIR
jgi:Xaa-Pro aminopeptidase